MRKPRIGKWAAKALTMMVAALLASSVCMPLQAIALQSAQIAGQAKVTVTVKKAPNGKMTLKKGKTAKLSASATKGAKIVYKSSNTKVACVSAKGTVSAKKAGKATITVKATKGGKSATKKVVVTVKDPAAEKAAKKKAAEEAAKKKAAEEAAKKAAEAKAAEEEAARKAAEEEAAAEAARQAEEAEAKAAEEAAEEAANKKAAEEAAKKAAEAKAAEEEAARKAAEEEAAAEAARQAEEAEAKAAEEAAKKAAEEEAARNATAVEATVETATKSTEETVSINGIVQANGEYYYYINGAMQRGWVKVGSNWCYCDASTGIMKRGGEFYVGSGYGSGSAAGAGYRLFNADGYLEYGWQTVDGAIKYYSFKNGVRAQGEVYLDKSDGVTADVGWRYFDTNGALQYHWQSVNGVTKYYNPSNGVRIQGRVWIDRNDGVSAHDGYRYFDSNGALYSGWLTVGSSARYYDPRNGSVEARGCTQVYHAENAYNTYYFDTSTGMRLADMVSDGYYFRAGDGVGFKIASLGSGTYEIFSALGGNQCLDVSAAGTEDAANVQTYQSNGTNAQVWRVQSVGGGYYTITNANSGKALDVQGGGKANGTNVFQWTANGTDAQKWMPLNYGAGLVLINKASGNALDVAGGVCGNCANVQSFEANWTNAQVWQFRAKSSTNPIGMTDDEWATAISVWNAYNDFRASKNVPRVVWSNECARLAYETCKAESRIGKMQHSIAIPVDKQMTYSDILQYATWRKSGSEVIDRWAKSEGHHRMMRNDNGTVEAGVGVYFDGTRWWYTIVYNFEGRNQYAGDLW